MQFGNNSRLLRFLILWIFITKEVHASRKRRTPLEDELENKEDMPIGSVSEAMAKSYANISLPEEENSNPNSKELKDPLNGFKLVCLFSASEFYRMGCTPALVNVKVCTHVHYEFAHLDGKSYLIKAGDSTLDEEMGFWQEMVDQKKVKKGLKVILAIGGWQDSTSKYSELASSKQRITKFCTHAAKFVQDRGFDGLDISWQYPNCWQGDCGCAKQDKKNFVTLVTVCSEIFHKENLSLSISVASITREISHGYTDVPTIVKAVDYINVMSYDMHGPWEKKTGHHTQFGPARGDADPSCNMKGAAKIWEDKGVPKEKLNLGIAMYGKTFTLKDDGDCRLGAPSIGQGKPGFKTMTAGHLSYSEMCYFLNSGNWTLKKDPQVGYYMCNGDQWVCFDNPMGVVKKTYYLLKEKYGGVLLKDLCSDDYEGECFSPHMKSPLATLCYQTALYECLNKLLAVKEESYN